jgi:hypothetical protein
MDVPQLVPMDDGRNGLCNFPTATDVLAEILVRLPPNVRRRLRLVCRLWRAVVDQRTATDMRARSKILAVSTEGLAYVVDLLSPVRPCRAVSWPKGRVPGRPRPVDGQVRRDRSSRAPNF